MTDRARYLDVQMPEHFAVQYKHRGKWYDDGEGWAESFMRMDDGSYLDSNGSSGFWIRATKIHPDGVIHHVDGGGNKHLYRLIALSNDSD